MDTYTKAMQLFYPEQQTFYMFPKDSLLKIAIDTFYKQVYGKIIDFHPPVVMAIMLKDMFFGVSLPYIHGTTYLNLWDYVVGINKESLILKATTQEDINICTDQLIDIIDFSFGMEELKDEKNISTEIKDFFELSKEHIEAACYNLLGNISKRVAIQECAYAIELAGKGLLKKYEISDKEIKEIGHDLPKLFKRIKERNIKLNFILIEKSLQEIPPVISERYNLDSINNLKIGNILRYTQYILGEISRFINNYNCRADLQPSIERIFPNIKD